MAPDGRLHFDVACHDAGTQAVTRQLGAPTSLRDLPLRFQLTNPDRSKIENMNCDHLDVHSPTAPFGSDESAMPSCSGTALVVLAGSAAYGLRWRLWRSCLGSPGCWGGY